MKKRALLLGFTLSVYLACIVSIIYASDLDPFKETSGTIRIAGGTAHIPVMKEAAKNIMALNPHIQITIAGGGSGVGIKQGGEGLVDIGNTGRKPTESEIAKYNLIMFKWAIDGVAIVVNPKNPVKSLSKEKLVNVYAGEINNWKTLGGTDKEINLYTRDKSSGTRDVFWKQALSEGKISNKANVVISNGAMKSAIANDPYGIGYVSVGHIDKTVTPVSFEGITPTLESVKNGSYTIARGLYSNTKGFPTGLTKMLIEYLYSQEGQTIIAAKGFIPVKK